MPPRPPRGTPSRPPAGQRRLSETGPLGLRLGVQLGGDAGDQGVLAEGADRVGGLRPGAGEHDHQLPGRVHMQALPENTYAVVDAAGLRPPLVAIAKALVGGRLLTGGFGDPALGQDRPARPDPAGAEELTHPAIVAQGHGQAAAARLLAPLIDHPEGVLLHAVGLPDLLGEIGREGLARGGGDQHPDQVGLAGLVDPFRARGGLAGQPAHVADGGVEARVGKVRLAILHPIEAGSSQLR